MRRLIKLARDERGATAIEYALLASLVSVAGIVGFSNLGASVDAKIEVVNQSM